MAKQALTMRVSVYGVRETIAAFDRLPREARREIEEASLDIARSMVPRLRFAAVGLGRQGPLLGSTVRALKDRVPVVSAGGAAPLGSRRRPAFKLLFGFEFGSDRYGQFRRHLGGGGSYWMFKTVFERQDEMMRRYLRAADAIIDKFTRNDAGRRA